LQYQIINHLKTDKMETKTKWVLDPTHSELTFKVKHMMITNVKGELKNYSVEVDGEDIFKSNVLVTIDAASINTNNTDRTSLKVIRLF